MFTRFEVDLVSRKVWICTGAAETLAGEVLDFAQKLQLPMDLWLHEGMFHDWPMCPLRVLASL